MSDTPDTSVLSVRGLRKHYGTGEGLVRDGAFVDATRLTGGTTSQLGALAGPEG